jgi:cbb3-type cytochrome oxidase maturation protein
VSLLFIVLPLSLLLVAVAVGVFVWAARSGQFDDLETPARRVLFDDDGAVDRGIADRASPAHDRSRPS